MMTCTERDYRFPPLPLARWEETRHTLHLFLQIVGKIRLGYHPKLNHWWHASLYPFARGLTTGPIPYCEREFEIRFDFIDHVLHLQNSDGAQCGFPLSGLSVADFYHRILEVLASFDMPVVIHPYPYKHPDSLIPFPEDTAHRSYDREAVSRYWQAIAQIANIFEEFRGRFLGKSTPVHVFWHSFDLALTRFSGRSAPLRPGGTPVDREAYSHEVISFGFWPGDPDYPEAAFYSYTYPAPEGLAREPLEPDIAFWGEVHGNNMALLNYEGFRCLANPRQRLLSFLESAYQAGARWARWPVEELRLAG